MWFPFLFLSFLFLLRVKADLEIADRRLNRKKGKSKPPSHPYRHFANPNGRKFELFDEKFYLSNYGESVISQNVSSYDHWVNKGIYEGKRSHGGSSVVAFVLMTKNDWPLIKHWVLYHGDKFGFNNLYVFDGSDDPQCINFLHAMRDQRRLTLIETKTGLDMIEKEISEYSVQNLVFRYDYIIKMDTDEFLVHYDQDKQRIAFDHVLDNLSAAVHDGIIKRVSFQSMTVPDRVLCENASVREHGPIFVDHYHSVFFPTIFKAIFPSASVLTIDLGGHGGRKTIHPDFQVVRSQVAAGTSCSSVNCHRNVPGLSVLHFHYGCMQTELENLKKALLSHGYISTNDSVKQQIAKLAPKAATAKRASSHKATTYYFYLKNSSQWENAYYENLSRPYGVNATSWELRDLIINLEAKYTSEHKNISRT